MVEYTGNVIDIDLVIASDDEDAINAAMDRLGWRSMPGVVDVDVMDRGFGDPYYLRMGGLLIDDSIASVADRGEFARSLAQALARELGVHVATAADYDGGNVFSPPAIKAG